MSLRAKLTRRGFATLAATATVAPRHASLAMQEAASPSAGTSPTNDASRLVVEQGNSLSASLQLVDQQLAPAGSVAMDSSPVAIVPTPDPGYIIATMLSDAFVIDVTASEALPIATDTGPTSSLFAPRPHNNDADAFGGRWFAASSMDMLAYLIDSQSGEATDISPYVVPEGQPVVGALPRFAPGNELLSLWTGNWVWIVDVNAPDTAYPLDGGSPDAFSTTASFSADGAWVGYTVYAANDPLAAGRVVMQRMDDRKPITIADGTAWSRVTFVPGRPDAFLLFTNRSVELRSLDDPAAAGERLGEIDGQPWRHHVMTSDGMHQAIGSRANENDPLRWQMLDLERGTMTPLDELDGLAPLGVTTWRRDPRYAAFGPYASSGEDSPPEGPIAGLDLMSGESFTLLEGVNLPQLTNHATSGDSGLVLLTSRNQGTNKGAWMLDLANREVVSLPYGENRLYTTSVAVTADGTLAAVGLTNPRTEAVETQAFATDAPGDLTAVAEGSPVLWT